MKHQRSKSDVHFCQPTPETPIIEKIQFFGLTRVSGSGQQKWTTNCNSTGQNTLKITLFDDVKVK